MLANCRPERAAEMAPEKPEVVKASPFVDSGRKGTLLPSRTSTAGTGAPASFYCPISMELMADPVMVATGHTYDRQASISHSLLNSLHKHPVQMELFAVRDIFRPWSAS